MISKNNDIIIDPSDPLIQFYQKQPGFYKNIPEPAYFSGNAVSSSLLNEFRKSPAHARAFLNRTEDSGRAKHFTLGSAIHAAVLEPDRFKEEFKVPVQCSAETGSGDQCSRTGSYFINDEWFCGTHIKSQEGEIKDVNSLSSSDYKTCIEIQQAVRKNEYAYALLNQKGNNIAEGSIVWNDKTTDLICKGRIDFYNEESGIIVDLKSTFDASINSFKKSMSQYGYYRQLAFYREGLKTLNYKVNDIYIIAVEKAPPYNLQIIKLKEDLVDKGWKEMHKAIVEYHEETKSGTWKGYPEQVIELSASDFEEEILTAY